jgi:hypothetical protein
MRVIRSTDASDAHSLVADRLQLLVTMRHRDLLTIFVAAISAAGALPACTMSSSSCSQPLPPPTSVTVSVSALEALESDAGDPADAGPPKAGDFPDYATCHALCPESSNCSVKSISGGEATITCFDMCTGRRPGGYCPPGALTGDDVGAHFARMAALEAASVVAFRGLAHELAIHRAPRALVKACRRAARDEIRHARRTSALARARGAAVSFGSTEPPAPRSVEAIAIENAVEGCVRETFGALVAHWQAREASDPVVRDAMKRIARDETRHAALSWSIDAWARSRLGRAARTRVDDARNAAARTLAPTGTRGTTEAFAAKIGLPSLAHERVLAHSFERAIVERGVPRS